MWKHWEDPSTHPEYGSNLKLKAEETSGPDKNWVYGISMTVAWDMRSGCSVSTLGTP